MSTMPGADAPDTDAAKVAAIGAAILGAGLAIAALALFGTRTGMSVAFGAAIAVANLVMMRALVRAMLRPAEEEAFAQAQAQAQTQAQANADAKAEASEDEDPVDHAAEGKRGAAAWGLFGVLKLVVLFGGIYILLTKGLIDPMPLVVGYGVLPLGIAASSLFAGLAPRDRRPGRPRPRTK